MPINYNPTFQHHDWVDNVDRVQAGGTNGFNIRFHTIEAEFRALAQIVQVIDTALSSLGQQVQAPVTIGFTPLLLPFGGNLPWSAVAWSRVVAGAPLGTFVEKPSAQDQAFGVFPLNLPDGVHLTNIKVLGEQTGAGDVTTELIQESRHTPYTRDPVVSVTGLAGAATVPTVIPNSPAVNTANNLYYILARVLNAAGSTVRLGFQITYQP